MTQEFRKFDLSSPWESFPNHRESTPEQVEAGEPAEKSDKWVTLVLYVYKILNTKYGQASLPPIGWRRWNKTRFSEVHMDVLMWQEL